MTIAIINRFIQIFDETLKALHAEAPMHEIERLAMLVHSAMENKRRFFHTSMHVFNICEGMNPRQVLAALFHDLVYYQLDSGFPQQSAFLLESIVRNESGSLILREIDKDDVPLQLCADIFGFEPEYTLQLFGGMNEFLSAVVAVRLLQPYLSMRDLLAVVSNIEATVPFCGTDAGGLNSASLLADRVRSVSRKLLEELPDEELEQYVAEVMHDAVQVANRDVGGFAEPNSMIFLSTTWLLIEESNAPLRDVGVYTIQDYRGALLRMEKFLDGLKAEAVFCRYANVPDEVEYARLTEAARRNIRFSCDFLGLKLTSIAIIEALAMITGGNCPVSMFLGDIRSSYGDPDRVEDFLSSVRTAADINPELLQVLESGRVQKSCKDLTESPLTAFIYSFLGHEGALNALRQSKRMFAGELQAVEFIKEFDLEMISAITHACAQIAISRREALLNLRDRLNQRP